ncbi:type VI secretion system-associated FHA domain protein TagH [Rhodanobacter glycinis]|uniref:Type VI secretion system-associated FHA domain protein TagH n=1 Tax=Rhodanobacter glycinis TaxID=582702 RepID=A0A502C7T0_9GAMM|nr:type VI secretion system-associated FHA domain protein TagH [Rhodanobacter glycinis]TPG08704.1 type VI secretion system-associated FHA domain protein TagH [Rhodanobacter glycinis]
MSQSLILAVAGRQAAQFGSRSRKTFEAVGGSIGRSEDCDWVLSASGVSRVHAMIRYLNGMYFIEDRSTNGMLLNDAPLIKGDPSALKDGDRLLIDTFEVEVHLQAATVASAMPDLLAPAPAAAVPTAMVIDPLDFDLLDPVPRAAAYPPSTSAMPMDAGLIPGAIDAQAGGELDPLSFLGSADTSSGLLSGATTGNASSSWNHSASTDDYFHPPMTTDQRQANALPENWDLTVGDFASPAPPSSPAPPAAVVASPVAVPARPPYNPTTPVAETTGSATLPPDVDQIFRVVVDGVMDVLRARAEIKNTFRLPVTIIQRSENNPLKFAPNPDEALQKIMAPSNGAFMSGTAAFEDAFDDIRCHQMAMLAGVRAAFESLLVHFNPDRFEQEADGSSKRSAFAGKGKYWDKYRENFDGLSRDPDECFRRLFGDEFARAYEEQLSRLKSARRMQKSARH